MTIRRREFITLLGGTAASPLAARAQQQALPVVGYLGGGAPESNSNLAAFRKGLNEMGFVEGRNVTIEYVWADGRVDRLPELAAELVRRRVAVIAVPAGLTAVLAAKAATTTIPVIFGIGSDPVETGLVASLNRPGANLTGVSQMNIALLTKQLGLLHEMLPTAGRFGVLLARGNPATRALTTEAEEAASIMGKQIVLLPAGDKGEIDAAFESIEQKRIDALAVSSQVLFFQRRVQIITLAARHGLPVIYSWRESPDIGGLMSYGANSLDQFRQVGLYTGRILKGDRPADLPVMRATKFEFVINLQTAKTLRIQIAPTLLAIADEVIE
jgi:putative ABC transport system substrate-binding protein